MSSIKTIIFDLGNVLIDWNPNYVFDHLIPDAERRQFFFKHICSYEWNLAQDAGRNIHEATEAKVLEHPDWEIEIRAYYGRWEEMLGGAIAGTLEILRGLIADPNYQVLALTNWSAETFPKAQKLYDFLGWFDGIVVSGIEKTRKPFPDIYHILLQRYAVNPHQAVFIDDSLANIQTAESLGIRGIHFQDPVQLREALQGMGVAV
jgi:2-haloacid dehalogenase